MANKSKIYSCFKKLPEPSFIRGVSKMADFSSLRERYAELLNDQNADFEALLSDWLAVGNDIQHALDEAFRDSDAKETA